MADAPLDHIVRQVPPWRHDGLLTECGRPISDVASVITRDDVIHKVRDQGKQRAAFTTCMTCADRAHDREWDADPIDIVRREAGWGSKAGDTLRRELRALTILYRAHAEEYREILAGLDDTTDLNAARATRQRRAAGGARG